MKKSLHDYQNREGFFGGQGGIRTHEPLARLPDFEFYRRLLITWFLLSVSAGLVRPQTRMKSGLFKRIARKY